MKNRFFKIFILILTFSFLFSCWESVSKNDNILILKKFNDFSISIPNSWVELDKDKWWLPKPSFWEIRLAISSPNLIWWFSSNLLILRDKTNKDISSKDFSIFSNIWIKEDYTAYKEISQRDIIFKDSEESVLFTFEARYNENTPRLRFLQTAHICDNYSYLLTIALSNEIEDSSKYETLLESFECNNLEKTE